MFLMLDIFRMSLVEIVEGKRLLPLSSPLEVCLFRGVSTYGS